MVVWFFGCLSNLANEGHPDTDSCRAVRSWCCVTLEQQNCIMYEFFQQNTAGGDFCWDRVVFVCFFLTFRTQYCRIVIVLCIYVVDRQRYCCYRSCLFWKERKTNTDVAFGKKIYLDNMNAYLWYQVLLLYTKRFFTILNPAFHGRWWWCRQE